MLVGLFLVGLCLATTSARSQDFSFSGLAYLDYEYELDPPGSAEQRHAFRYRRIYLTSDFRISEHYDGRLRFEMQDDHLSDEGLPVPFVKDFWIRRNNAFGGDHEIAVGVLPPPVMLVSEEYWGFRSLAKTLLDRQGIASTRDFGLRLRGPLSRNGRIRYGVMYANNSGIGPETNEGKRLYAQLEGHPNDRLSFTLGGDYASSTDNTGEALTANAFLGFAISRSHVGLEAYLRSEDAEGADILERGLSVFARSRVEEKVELVARYDMSAFDDGGVSDAITSQFLVIGAAYLPEPNVQIIPNVLFDWIEDQDRATALARLTLHIDIQ